MEKILCKTYPGSKISHIDCNAKYIDRNNLKISISMNISRPIHDIWLHVEPYYKFNKYTRIAGHIWENGCDWLAGKKSFLLDYYAPRVLKYTNLNHSCPYTDYIFAKIDNISVQQFAFPQIAPSGRYYLDIYATESDRSQVLANLKVYASISDHRVEIV